MGREWNDSMEQEMRLMTQLDRIQPANKEVLTGARIRRWECHDECLMSDPKHETNKRKIIAYLVSKPLYLPSQRNMSIITLSAPYVSGSRGGGVLSRPDTGGEKKREAKTGKPLASKNFIIWEMESSISKLLPHRAVFYNTLYNTIPS